MCASTVWKLPLASTIHHQLSGCWNEYPYNSEQRPKEQISGPNTFINLLCLTKLLFFINNRYHQHEKMRVTVCFKYNYGGLCTTALHFYIVLQYNLLSLKHTHKKLSEQKCCTSAKYRIWDTTVITVTYSKRHLILCFPFNALYWVKILYNFNQESMGNYSCAWDCFTDLRCKQRPPCKINT